MDKELSQQIYKALSHQQTVNLEITSVLLHVARELHVDGANPLLKSLRLLAVKLGETQEEFEQVAEIAFDGEQHE